MRMTSHWGYSAGQGENQENNAHLPKSNFFTMCQTCNLKRQWSVHSLLQMPFPESEVSQGTTLIQSIAVLLSSSW